MSNTKNIPLSEASVDEMRQFAASVLGLPESPPNIKAETIRAKIAEAWDKDFIIGSEQVEQPDKAPAEVEINDNAEDGEVYDTIFIDKTEEAGGADPVWVSVNGRGLWIPRGEEVKVRHRYTHVLENAVKTVYDQSTAPDGKPGDLVARQVPAYPFRKVA